MFVQAHVFYNFRGDKLSCQYKAFCSGKYIKYIFQSRDDRAATSWFAILRPERYYLHAVDVVTGDALQGLPASITTANKYLGWHIIYLDSKCIYIIVEMIAMAGIIRNYQSRIARDFLHVFAYLQVWSKFEHRARILQAANLQTLPGFSFKCRWPASSMAGKLSGFLSQRSP